MAKRTKADPKDFLDDVSKALARPGTSYLEAAEKLRVHKNTVKRPAEELGGRRQEAWSLLQMGENAIIAVAKLPVLLQLLCARTPALFEAFHKAAVAATEKPLSLILSFDERQRSSPRSRQESLHGVHRLQGGWDAKSRFMVAYQCGES